eukprot:766752-Hanusia_phi.AAC.13
MKKLGPMNFNDTFELTGQPWWNLSDTESSNTGMRGSIMGGVLAKPRSEPSEEDSLEDLFPNLTGARAAH